MQKQLLGKLYLNIIDLKHLFLEDMYKLHMDKKNWTQSKFDKKVIFDDYKKGLFSHFLHILDEHFDI